VKYRKNIKHLNFTYEFTNYKGVNENEKEIDDCTFGTISGFDDS
jgi:hypothetical protein